MNTQQALSQKAFEILSSLGKDFKHHRSDTEILTVVAHRVYELTSAPRIYAVFKDRLSDSLELVLRFEDGEVQTSQANLESVLSSIGREQILQVIDTQANLLLNQQETVDRCASWLGVPISSADQAIGVLVIQHPSENNAFSSEVGQILDAMTDLAASAIEYYRLYQRTRLTGDDQHNFEQRIKDLERLGDIYGAVNQNPLEDVLDLVLETAVSFTRADYAEICFCDFDHNVIEVVKDYQNRRSKWFKGITLSTTEGLVGRAISSKEPCYSGNVKEDDDYVEVSPDVNSELVIPLVFQGKPLGTFNLESKRINAFSPEQQKLAKTLGDSITVAFENSKKNSQLKLYLSLLEELEKLTFSEAPFDEEFLSEYIHNRASELMDTGNMYIALYNPENGMVEFKMVYLRGERRAPYKSRKLTEGRGRTEQIIRTHKSLRHTSEESKQWYAQGKDYTNQDDDLPWLGVPMLLGRGDDELCLGVIATYSADKTYVYTSQEQAVLEKMGRWAAIALENAKTTKRVAEQQNMLTRSLVAQDLIHRLNSIAGTVPIWLQLLEMEIDTFEGINVSKAKDYIAQSLSELKALILQINRLGAPEPETKVNLKQVLVTLIEQFRILYKQYIDVQKLSIEDNLAEDLYDVVGFPSLIANSLESVLKNGVDAVLEKGKGCVSVVAENSQVANTVKIVITDTGVGIPNAMKADVFAPFFSTKKSGIGYGLWRAKSVFEKMGGRISFESQPDRQTTFTITLPREE
ncbi:MAG: GAF domain-containing protein [Leptolyngbyaceae cyanobacterium MO_188.B28]|nr:GAF domain-containing protein [Leptolyngbyaceae cyanobacterium MO_188.B28]